jgi:hypothetical protein
LLTENQEKLLKRYYKAINWIISNDNYKNNNAVNNSNDKTYQEWKKLNKEIDFECENSQEFKKYINELIEKIDKDNNAKQNTV